METLPSYAKVSEYQLGIVNPDDTSRNVMNLKIQAAPKAREYWSGQLAFAPMTVSNSRTLLAWLSQFDGRKDAFLLPLPSGIQTITGSHTGTLAFAATAGADEILVSVTPTGTTIKAGTLITIGSYSADAYQVVEVLDDVLPSAGSEVIFTDATRFTDGTAFEDTVASVSVPISPRVRWPFNAGEALTFGATSMRVRLDSDDALSQSSFELSHGIVSLKVIEAVYA